MQHEHDINIVWLFARNFCRHLNYIFGLNDLLACKKCRKFNRILNKYSYLVTYSTETTNIIWMFWRKVIIVQTLKEHYKHVYKCLLISEHYTNIMNIVWMFRNFWTVNKRSMNNWLTFTNVHFWVGLQVVAHVVFKIISCTLSTISDCISSYLKNYQLAWNSFLRETFWNVSMLILAKNLMHRSFDWKKFDL